MTITGDTVQAPVYDTFFTITGTAPANGTVSLNFHKAGTAADDYSIVRTVQANAQGVWVREIVANVDYRYYASNGASTSGTILNTPAPTVDGPSSRTVAADSDYAVSGTAVPGSTVYLHFHRWGTPAQDYSIVRSVKVNRGGEWTRSYRANDDYRLFASRDARGGNSGDTYLYQAR